MNATRVEGSRESECLKRNIVVRGKVLKIGPDRPVQQTGGPRSPTLSSLPIPNSQITRLNPSLASTSQLSIPVSQSTRVQCRRRRRSPSCSSTPSPLNYHAFVPDFNVDAAPTPIPPCLWFSKSPTLTPLNLQSTTVSVCNASPPSQDFEMD
ncbi:hypothetical protein PIB30_012050 [Stylosanthes scabra]|uniref:Uncharacterized protein n=1 Tax=Stylosanthes scabra TaxID=79078 RepID=A0ABU6Q5U4_9FABA|nr:hypothetical protein [Stylosanthes scabra]